MFNKGIQHVDEEQGTEYGALKDTNFHLELLAVTLADNDITSSIGVHDLD